MLFFKLIKKRGNSMKLKRTDFRGMKRVNNREMVNCMKHEIPCKANSAYATFNMGGIYCVYSYDTCIFKNYGKYGYYFDNRDYSPTTSKLQGRIKLAFGLSECNERKVYGENWTFIPMERKLVVGV